MEPETLFKKGGWSERKETAARLILEGLRIKDIALMLAVSERQIYRWKNEPEFFHFQNEYLMNSRGEYLLLAKQEARDAVKKDKPSKRDLLDWLKFISAETSKIDFSDPIFGIPPERLGNYMNKVTRKSLDKKNKTGRK